MTEIITSTGNHFAIIDRNARANPAKTFAAIGNIGRYHRDHIHSDPPTWTDNMRVYGNGGRNDWPDIPMEVRFPVYIFFSKPNDHYEFEII